MISDSPCAVVRSLCSELQEAAPDDPMVNRIIGHLVARSIAGKKKYGVTLEREDLSLDNWLNHALEEMLDAAAYLQVVKRSCPLRIFTNMQEDVLAAATQLQALIEKSRES